MQALRPLEGSSCPPHIPDRIPRFVYRAQHSHMQTRYSFSEGFRSKNQTTILSQCSTLNNFGLAHLNHQTNISSPFISVYDNQDHAEAVAKWYFEKTHEKCYVVMIDTEHLARGPIFRAANLLLGKELTAEQEWLHRGEYLIMYRIPPQAIRMENPIGQVAAASWMAPGVGLPGAIGTR